MEFKGAVLERYKLSPAEGKALGRKIAGTVGKIGQEIRKSRARADVVVGGSASKGTILKGDFDVDIFVRFDRSHKDGEISNILGRILKPFKPARLQGSRDYFQFEREGIHYEIVPVLKINGWRQAVNVTDASPLHVVWVNSRIRKNPRLVDEIIIAKVFLKANRLYGAESYISGFSGHVVDILVLNYGGFLRFLRAAAKWKPFAVVDVERHFKGREPELNQSKIGPLILIDPVQPQRNAAAAVNLESFNRLVEVARRYLKNPSQKFFERRELDVEGLKRLAGKDRLIALELLLKKGKLDVNGARMVKALEFLEAKLIENEFKVVKKGWEWDRGAKAVIWLAVDKASLSRVKVHAGPPVELKEHAAAFRKLYRKTSVKEGRLFAEVKREFVEPSKLVEELIKQGYISERFKKIIIKGY
jgi:tRNA nucleotidyltransferase (CCA-adding enzyme)